MLCAIVFVLPGIVIGYERDIEQGSGEVQHYMCSEHFAKLLSVSTVWLQITGFFQTFWGELKSIFTRLVHVLVSICDDKNADKCTR